jgi:hypothetical protein
MTECFTFTNTLAGLRLFLHTTMVARANGFTTVGIVGPPERFGALGNRLLHLEVTPPEQPNREARGCNLTGRLIGVTTLEETERDFPSR